MDVKELISKKKELESQILGLIHAFEEETDASVKNVSLRTSDFIYDGRRLSKVIDVDTEVKI